MINCPHCGAPNPEQATACRECGRPFPAAGGAESPAPSTASTPGGGGGPAPSTGTHKTADTAVASLICGILGWSFLPFAGAVLAVILGHMAKVDIRQSEGRLEGDGLATVGLLLGYANLAIFALGLILFVLLTALGIAATFGIGICGLCGA